MFTFLADEKMLSHHTGSDIGYPIRLFDLNSCGINSSRFINAILPSFYQLKWDHYTVKQQQLALLLRWFPKKREEIIAFFSNYYIGHTPFEVIRDILVDLDTQSYQHLQSISPYRRRSIASFVLFREQQQQIWAITRRSSNTFTQRTNDYRMLPRRFPTMSGVVTEHPDFKKLLTYLAQLVQSIRPEIQRLQLVCHQVSLVACPDSPADNAPEGVHQDGADYIVSAIVCERRNVQGGTSIIYGPDKQTSYLTITLQPGQGIFQADQGSGLWHDVTPIVFDSTSYGDDGVRNILGFDILIDQ